MARVVLGVCAGIAAYKSAELLRALTEAGHDVRVVPTQDALRFVGAATWEALSGNPVATEVWSEIHQVRHVRMGKEADLVVIAPATADLIASATAGRADDLLTATLLTTRAPVLFAPAMHTEMWEHPATVANVQTLRERGSIVIDPAVGRLTGSDSGVGRFPDPQHLAALAELLLMRSDALPRDLVGRQVLITAGGTREFADPVRFVGNRSSGRQGFALALTAAARGAKVCVVAANVSLPAPPGAKVVPVTSAGELRDAVFAELSVADVVVMTAAVADFRPAEYSQGKIKRGEVDPAPLPLVRNPDVLAEVMGARRPDQVIVGFAAEVGDGPEVLARGRDKLSRKGCDVMVVNPVGPDQGFDVADNSGVILTRDGREISVPLTSKTAVAATLWDTIATVSQ